MEIKKNLLIFKIKSRIAHQQNVASQRISGGYKLYLGNGDCQEMGSKYL